jgi:pimeloyl-ACP methyl ester carboxylesterase
VALVAVGLLYVGFGTPHRGRAPHRAEWIEVNGLGTRVVRAGQGDTTLVFLHGYGESLMSWRLVLDRFPRRYRVLALDLPGFGLSAKPDSSYDFDFYRRWLGAVLAQETEGPVVVVGHSMGGQLAAALALDHPERVVAAVLLAPAGLGINTLFTDTTGLASPAAAWVASALAFVLPVHDTAWVEEPAEWAGYQPANDTLATRAARRILVAFDFGGLAAEFPRLRQPVLLLWGRHDPTIPVSLGDSLAAALPCRRYVVLPTLHRPHQTLPDTVAGEMLRFLGAPGCG